MPDDESRGDTRTCSHTWTLIHRLNHCEIDEADPIVHTAIVLMGCIHCRIVDAFPPENMALITDRYRSVISRDLARQGWHWPPKGAQ
jgi:hypothetical protein